MCSVILLSSHWELFNFLPVFSWTYFFFCWESIVMNSCVWLDANQWETTNESKKKKVDDSYANIVSQHVLITYLFLFSTFYIRSIKSMQLFLLIYYTLTVWHQFNDRSFFYLFNTIKKIRYPTVSTQIKTCTHLRPDRD